VRIYEDGGKVGSLRERCGAGNQGRFRVRAPRGGNGGEAYLSGLSQFRRDLLPMSSMIILSEPLTPAQWEEIGWAAGDLSVRRSTPRIT
jgi:hypothetical protein